MYHDFLLIKKKSEDYSEFWDVFNDPKALKVHDDLIRYIADSLNWVPAMNPASSCEDCRGLCYYGPTVIKAEGARVLGGVLRSWVSVFKNGPKDLELTGGWIIPAESENSNGHYEMFAVDRDAVIDTFKEIAKLCDEVVAGKGDYYLLHLGI